MGAFKIYTHTCVIKLWICAFNPWNSIVGLFEVPLSGFITISLAITFPFYCCWFTVTVAAALEHAPDDWPKCPFGWVEIPIATWASVE